MLTTPHADSVILDTARSTGAAVLSRDGSVAHRRVHSWIQGDSEHFWRWTVDRDARVEIRLQPMGVRNDYSITRAVQKGDLKRLGLEDAELREAVLARVYFRPGGRGPRSRSGRRQVELKFLMGGQDVGFEVLGDGELVTLRTAPSSGTTVDVSEFGEAGRINPSHLKLSVLVGQLVVEPMAGSSAQVQRWRDRRWEAPEDLSGLRRCLRAIA